MGARLAVITGGLIVAVGSALRDVGLSVSMLFAMTVTMAAGIAVMQPGSPALVGNRFVARVPLATAVYVNGLKLSER